MSETAVRALIREAENNGVKLWMDNGQLQFKAEKGKLTDELRAALRARKAELIGELSVPKVKKSASPPAVASFHPCSKDFWAECKANTTLRHGTHFAIKLTGRIELERFEAAFKQLSSRHDLLRSTVGVSDDGLPFLQLVDNLLPVEILDLSGSAYPQIKSAVEQAIYAPFEEGRIHRAQVIKVADAQYVVALVIHHFVADAISLSVLLRELLGELEASNGSPLATRERPLQYADYIIGKNEWLAGPGLEYRMGLWREKMRGAQGVRFPQVEERHGSGPTRLEILELQVEEKLRTQVARAVSAAKVPFPIAILAANFAALARTFQRGDFFTVLLHLDRDAPALFDMVGFTINCIPVRVTVSPQMSYRELMAHVHDAFEFARDYQVPWNMLLPLLEDAGASCVGPLFNYLYAAPETKNAPPSSSREHGGFSIEPLRVEGPEPTNSVDWKSYELHAFDNGESVQVTMKYMPSAYKTAAVMEFAETFLRCLAELGDNPQQRVWAGNEPALKAAGASA